MTTTVQTQSEYRDMPLDWLVRIAHQPTQNIRRGCDAGTRRQHPRKRRVAALACSTPRGAEL